MTSTATAALTPKGILFPEGACKIFDAAADGLGSGEAIIAVYVKRLDDAIRDGNPVRAIIRNTGANNDGRDLNPLQPNVPSQESLMHNVYQGAGLAAEDTAFVEVLSIFNVFCDSFLIHTSSAMI